MRHEAHTLPTFFFTATHTRAECHYLNFRELLEPLRDDGKKKILRKTRTAHDGN